MPEKQKRRRVHTIGLDNIFLSMFDFVINNNTYSVPEDFTLDKWKDLARFDVESEFSWAYILKEAMEIPDDEIEIIPDKTKSVGVIIIYNVLYPSDCDIVKEIGEHKLINFDDITLGDFIDLEILFNKGLRKTIDGIAKKLYGLNDTKDITLRQVWGAIQSYIRYRETIFKGYSKLFGIDEEGEIKEEIEKISPEYMWYDLIMVLADEKFLNIKEVVNHNVKECFNFLAWKKDKLEEEKKQIDDIRRNHNNNRKYM